MAPTGGRRDKAQLRFEDEYYSPEGAKALTEKQLRKEYSRLRSIARKRLERFEGTEWTDTQIYQLNVGKYKPLPEITTDRELRHLFSEVARFITRETSSVSGLEAQRRNTVQSLNERGYEFVTKQNFRQFADFMEYARMAKINKMYDSKRIAEFYNMASKAGVKGEALEKAFTEWATNEMEHLKRVQNINFRDSDQYRKQIENFLDRGQTGKVTAPTKKKKR